MLDASIGSDLSLSPSSLSLGASRADDATKLVDRPTAPVAAPLADDPVAHLAELGARASECASQGDFAQAAEYLESALAGAERAFGKHHDAVVPFLNNLAQLHFRRRDFAAAEPVLVRLLGHKEKLGPQHPEVASVLSNLSVVGVSAGRFDWAEAVARRALAIRERAFGPNAPVLATTLEQLSDACAGTGKFAEAIEHRERAVSIRERALGSGHASVAIAHAKLDGLRIELEAARHAPPPTPLAVVPRARNTPAKAQPAQLAQLALPPASAPAASETPAETPSGIESEQWDESEVDDVEPGGRTVWARLTSDAVWPKTRAALLTLNGVAVASVVMTLAVWAQTHQPARQQRGARAVPPAPAAGAVHGPPASASAELRRRISEQWREQGLQAQQVPSRPDSSNGSLASGSSAPVTPHPAEAPPATNATTSTAAAKTESGAHRSSGERSATPSAPTVPVVVVLDLSRPLREIDSSGKPTTGSLAGPVAPPVQFEVPNARAFNVNPPAPRKKPQP